MLKVVIITYFTMKSPVMNQSEIKDFPIEGLRIETDRDGCYFMPHTRETMSSALPTETLAGIEAWSALRIAGRLIHMSMERWAEQHGLSEGRMSVLFRLRKAPEQRMAMSELAYWCSTTPRNITGLVDNLERDGLVRRVPDPEDRRSVQAQLTPAGMEKIDALWRVSIEAQTVVTNKFSKEELKQLRHLCLKLVQLMKEEMPR